MSEGAASTAHPEMREPISGDFEYEVRLNVAIPLSWAKVLKTIGENHYDWKCRESADCGVVNALHNTALFNEDPKYSVEALNADPRFAAFSKLEPTVSKHPISWRDCDLMTKIMEMADYHSSFDRVAVDAIRKWLRSTQKRISARHEEIIQ